MSSPIYDVAAEVNRQSSAYRFGELPFIRKKLKGIAGAVPRAPFTQSTIKDHYAFHYGGRAEIQFNIGFETVDGRNRFRHGVAFSLEPSRNLPDIRVLFPKVNRFNEFMRLLPEEYGDMRMWIWRTRHQPGRSIDVSPAQISDAMMTKHRFIMLGIHYDPSELSVPTILADFDRLLPLYEFVESNQTFPLVTQSGHGLQFTPGNRPRALMTRSIQSVGEHDVVLRHNRLQMQLHAELESEFGHDSVSSECGTGLGTRVDTVVRQGTEITYFEIKVGNSARSCIRQALAQLMEYAYWPGSTTPDRLVVVGEPVLDPSARTYLDKLRNQFGLPIDYRQVRVA